MTEKVLLVQLLMSCAYLVQQNDRLILVDAGIPGEEKRILRSMASAGYGELNLIFITHAHIDHYGSADALRDLTGAPVAVHRADSQALARGETRLGTAKGIGKLVMRLFPAIQRIWPTPPIPADIILEDGDSLSTIGIDATVLHTPGHTFGSSSLLVSDAAFVGDLLTTTRGHPRLQRFYAESWPLLKTSLDGLIAAGPNIVYPGHGRKPLDPSDLLPLAANELATNELAAQ